MDCAINPEEFWTMSIAEIMDRIDSFNRVKKIEFKQQTEQFFTLADVIGNRIASLFAEKGSVDMVFPWDAYPNLFTEDKAEYDRWKREEELENYKNWRIKQAIEINANFEEGGE